MSANLESDAVRPRVTPHLVLLGTFLFAFVGVFPYHLLFLVPLAASLTLAGVQTRARVIVAALSAGMVVIGLLMGLTQR